jgi:hypothetical protein
MKIKINFSLTNSRIIINSRRSPSSLPHLICEKKNESLAHFYSRNYGNEILGSGKELLPSRVLYIGPIKRLNDYYAPRA